MLSDNKIFTLPFTRLFIANTMIVIAFYMLMPTLPVHITRDLHIDEKSVGLILGIFSISSLVIRPLVGIALDRIGRKIIYIPGVIIFGFCIGGYIFAYSFLAIMLIRIIHGMSWASITTSNSTMIADIVEKRYRGTAIGYFSLSISIGMAIGPAAGVFLMNYISFQNIFISGVILVTLSLLSSYSIKLPELVKDKSKITIKTLYELKVIPIAIMYTLYGASYSAATIFSSLHGIDLKVKHLWLFFVILALFMGVFRPYVGRIIDKTGPGKILYIGFSLLVIGLIMLGLATNTFFFHLSAVFLGTATGFIMPTCMTMVINIVSPTRRGAATSTFFTAFDIGIGVGVIIQGFVIDNIGYRNMYVIFAVVALSAMILFKLYVFNYYNQQMKKIENSQTI